MIFRYPDIRYLDFQRSDVLVCVHVLLWWEGLVDRTTPELVFREKHKKKQKLVTTGTCVTETVSVDPNWCRNPKSRILADVDTFRGQTLSL